MRPTLWISCIALSSRLFAAQSSDPAKSPASQSAPRTVTPQAYADDLIRAGELRFTSQCGFCHGRDAAGGETGPDLTRSALVAADARGDKIAPLIRAGLPDKGMPAFTLNDTDVSAIVAFIHDRKTKSEALGGGRRSVDVADLATGSAKAGRAYFNGAGKCSQCHSAKTDLAHIAARYRGLTLLRRILYPSGQPTPKPAKVSLTTSAGQTIAGSLAAQDEFTLTVLDASGEKQTYQRSAVKFNIDDPVSAHFDQLGRYTDSDMHNVYAYLATLK